MISHIYDEEQTERQTYQDKMEIVGLNENDTGER